MLDKGFKILIYGAAGYTGKLITDEAVKKGFHPVLAGRNSAAKELADQYKLEYRIFNLDNPYLINQNLEDISLVVNAAGPFSKTNLPLALSCIKTKSHYIDISGELNEFESLYRLDEAAKSSQVMLMPGVGFGIVPSDSVADFLSKKLPNADKLTLAYAVRGGISRGTLKTVLNDLLSEGSVRTNGRYEVWQPASQKITFNTGKKKWKASNNPWRGDLLSAYLTTKIPNIETYSWFPSFLVFMMQYGRIFKPIFTSQLLQKVIDYLPIGPSEKQQSKGKTYVYGKIEKGNQAIEALFTGPESYILTAHTSVEIMLRILNNQVKPGFQTPAGMYGHGLIKNITGVELVETKHP